MAEHHLTAQPETVHWGYFDAELEPVLTIEPGDIVVVDTVSGSPEYMPEDATLMLPDHAAIHEALTPELGPHIITGPIRVAGAAPGDAVELEILDISFRSTWGWNAQKPGLGTLPEEFPETAIRHIGIDGRAGTALMPWGQQIPLAPFFGILAVAPPPERGRVSSKPPDVWGGNIDNKELGIGSRTFLPVFTDGALVSIGDGHGVQGDGEVCLTALETSLTGTFRIELHKGLEIPGPRAENATHLITHGFDPDLDEAARIALRAMLDWIVAESGLTRSEAYTLCSLACDLRVTQLVDGNKGIHAMVRTDLVRR